MLHYNDATFASWLKYLKLLRKHHQTHLYVYFKHLYLVLHLHCSILKALLEKANVKLSYKCKLNF